MPVKAVVFDMDGLMFDTEQLYLDCWDYVEEQMGITVDREALKETIGLNSQDSYRVLERIFGPGEHIDLYRHLNDEEMVRRMNRDGISLKKGLFMLLDFLRDNGYKKAVATSTSCKSALFMLEKAGVLPYFDFVVCGDMIQRGKPDPQIYLTACEGLSELPQVCAALEDSYNGIISASRAGMVPVMVPDLIAPTEELARHYRFRVPSLLDVIDLLKNGAL